MKSIPTIFLIDKETRTVVNKQLKMVDWVFQGKGVPTRKWDGIAIKVENGKVFRRYEWKSGTKAGLVPIGFIRVQEPDPKRPLAPLPGWVAVPDTFVTNPKGADEKALQEAWNHYLRELNHQKALIATKTVVSANIYAPAPELHPVLTLPNGTYELCGPKIHGNHENLSSHVLYPHGQHIVKKVPRTYENLKAFLEKYDGEGIVWHYKLDNGIVMMAKIKRRDFGFFTRISKEDIAMAYGQADKSEDIKKGPALAIDTLPKEETKPSDVNTQAVEA